MKIIVARVNFSFRCSQEIKRKLVSEIYQLRLECDRLADEVDKRSDPRGLYFISNANNEQLIMN